MKNRASGPTFDAVVLAGGRAARLGTSKPQLVVAGARLLDHVLTATDEARVTAVVGPPELASDAYRLTREDPPFGGPVAGTAAGLAALRTPPLPDDAPGWVLLLACDVPRAAEGVPLLLAAVSTDLSTGPAADSPCDGVHLVHAGRAQWLVGLYRRTSLERRVQELSAQGSVHGAPVRRLVAGLDLREVEDAAGLSTDIDTWEDAHTYERPTHRESGGTA
ncbi:molybdenum cofactor guanylyltransferase [Oerskovia flava]|uniref:molybdenum cofactor guanylyltransferase n=1 Tax=Oerskovia flava TaxID=2986422 RepID=UPI00223EECD0|nr:NTP transferase domain-containing protein [Oerskovia sp. JB1-3-2]